LAHQLVDRADREAQQPLLSLAEAVSDWHPPRAFPDLGPHFSATLRSAQRLLESKIPRPVFNRAVVAYTASTLPYKIADLSLPADVVSEMPAALERLHAFLSLPGDADYDLPHDYFLKDIRFAAGWTVPCGAQVVDLRSKIRLGTGIAALRTERSLRLAPRLLRRATIAPWFRPHTESRFLDDFNEAGWDRTYLRVASLLQRHPKVIGMAAYSWFYDPQLDDISPRLSYLRKRPVERGAILVRGGTSPTDVANATQTSATRQRLHEAAEYIPVAHELLWLRDDMLRWATERAS
jgi:hypothetical protein